MSESEAGSSRGNEAQTPVRKSQSLVSSAPTKRDPHPLAVKRTELVWEGKYDAEGRRVAPLRVALPFQTVETVNESAADRKALALFAGRISERAPWRNRLIWGDKKYVLPSLLPEFAGKVNLIYIDPPFDTGADFSFTASVPDLPETPEEDSFAFTKEPSIIEQKAYRDTWGRGLDSYLQWFYETVVLLQESLNDTGSLYVHCDYHAGHYIKLCLDQVFGLNGFRNEIVWKSQSPSGRKVFAKQVPFCHETILWYSKSGTFAFNPQFRPYDEAYIEERFTKTDARGRYKDYEIEGFSNERLAQLKAEDRIIVTPSGRLRLKQYLHESKGVLVDSVWTDIAPVNSQAKEDTRYATQKPEALLERIIRASSNEGDLVLDCFCGSGTTAAVAEKLKRRWIACDLGRFAIHTTRKRLLAIPGVRPFVVQNLGKYERQLWQSQQFPLSTIGGEALGAAVRPLSPIGGEGRGEGETAARQRAYIEFMLSLYHAKPLSGYTWLNGVRNGRMVHVGGVDAPVSVGDVKNIAAEFRKAVGTGADAPATNGVDVLGWDFAFDLNEIARQQAAAANIQMRFLRIPRDVMDKRAVEQGDIHFFELAALQVAVTTKKREVTFKLTEFVIPPDDVPEEARKAVKHWSQWIDYWAVDWDFKGDTFHNQWQAYRTRKDPALALETTHTYPEPGEYTIQVKVIDILGNDTTKTLRVEVK